MHKEIVHVNYYILQNTWVCFLPCVNPQNKLQPLDVVTAAHFLTCKRILWAKFQQPSKFEHEKNYVCHMFRFRLNMNCNNAYVLLFNMYVIPCGVEQESKQNAIKELKMLLTILIRPHYTTTCGV